ncbi:hypothetical protein BJY04DRAFT_206253 [Aspergillus karnatakaensis]|uniref:putative C2H2 finger domain protein n=1 Tax=Aspergillus karnatakaensis TaxID=1810916 RepID=UPI003CCDE9B9
MSAVSPQFVQTDSATDRNRNFDPELSNLYLSTAIDPEEADFQTSGIRLTPVDDRGSAWNGSASPLEHTANNISTPSNNEGYGTSYSEFLSPSEEWTSDISGHNSPADFFTNSMWPTTTTPAQNVHTPAPNRFGSNPVSPPATMNPSQLLTPNRTNNPSPSSDTTSLGSHRLARSHHPPIPRLITAPLNESLGPQPVPDSITVPSPIVKVESYSRGDSPVRDSFTHHRRPSQSSVHLSPGGISNASEEDVTIEADRPSVSRSADGTWLRSGVAGGLAPDVREDAYIPSPNEMESQRKLAEKNADIYIWSSAVSDAHSDAGDEYLSSQRGRTDHQGNRRRAKSTGDPSLHQQDYFSFKVHTHETKIPGPGLVLQETSDFSDDGSDSSAPASEIIHPEPQIAETDEPLPHQFLGAAPWQDTERDSAPRTTQIQPISSQQAIQIYTDRVREYDALSRTATRGTRDLDANSIRSFQRMSLNPKEKGHGRRSSLLKYLPGKQNNILKRQRQRSDLSTAHAIPEGSEVPGAEMKSTSGRKDSFPRRKLSLGLSPKSPSYSIGGAVMATTRQVAAIGVQDSLKVVSPGSSTKPWDAFKARGRSRSEVPRAPGLFELMTSHGGPPVPNINYTSEPGENETAQQTIPEQDPVEEEDDEDNDRDGLVMDFPIPPNLPLNPRLSPALVERFAHEQVRRYKRLIEVKQTHARDVGHGKCKAGKFCLSLGGEPKLLPPRPSAQDADSFTQFQIPGRGEAEEGPDGETTIALAQFPPGVPQPPSQVTLLPAEFECMVCFHVKKFQKPSDWTKHIYEDVQPFTCTFPECTDPKSFKRKADWVRHESERHRQLEWWECNFADCRHKCYRKDNFVQHLVREHKLPEPKVKKSKTRRSSGRGPNDPITPEMQEEINREQEVKQLWDLVEGCRHDTTKSPREEPCRFCGNVCTNWKKLTVHLAKHMEQMAIPILGLVDEREFPHNNGGGSELNADTSSGQLLITQGTSDFAPNLNGVADGPGPSINFTHAQYPNNHAVAPLSLAIPYSASTSYLPVTSMPMDGPGPSQLSNFDGVSQYATHNGGVSGPNELANEQARLMAMHQNSVTYPPPFNAGPRPRASNQDLRVLPAEYNNFSMSPTEMQYDPHNAMYVSSGAENHYTYHGPMASGMHYNAGGYQGQGQ